MLLRVLKAFPFRASGFSTIFEGLSRSVHVFITLLQLQNYDVYSTKYGAFACGQT